MADGRGRKVGNYMLMERLGQGGMGVVYRARDTMLDRDVALKMMQPPGEEQTRAEIAARFFVEAKAAARIQSRHVAQVLQLGETDEGEVYIVMELLSGEALSKVLQTEGRLEPERAVRIARQIAKGMNAAHALGVVHRDLKPANVMLVSADGEDEVVKILDFGVAKLTRDEGQANLTQTGALLGTLPYMAPEQILGKPVDARTDVYALGVVLYRMLAGAPLFDAESLSDVVRHQVQTPAPSFSARVPGLAVPRAIEAVVLRCLAKDPAKRYASMSDVDVALGRALESRSEPSNATVVEGRKIEETLPTGTKLPAGARAALTSGIEDPAAEETRSVFVDQIAHPITQPDAAQFPDVPVTVPQRPAHAERPLLPLAAMLAVAVAAVAVAVAVVLVMMLGAEPAPVARPIEPKPVAPTPVEGGVEARAEPSEPAPPAAPPAATTEPAPSVPESAPLATSPPPDAPPPAPLKPPTKPAAKGSTTTPKAPTKPPPKAPAKPPPKAAEPAPASPDAPAGFRRVLTKEGG